LHLIASLLEVKRSYRLKARESHPSCMHVLTTASSPALQVKRSYRLKAREYHPDKYAGSKSCAEMHFHSLRAAQEAALLMCK
jgi:curved DNA-binding protein CbpA